MKTHGYRAHVTLRSDGVAKAPFEIAVSRRPQAQGAGERPGAHPREGRQKGRPARSGREDARGRPVLARRPTSFPGFPLAPGFDDKAEAARREVSVYHRESDEVFAGVVCALWGFDDDPPCPVPDDDLLGRLGPRGPRDPDGPRDADADGRTRKSTVSLTRRAGRRRPGLFEVPKGWSRPLNGTRPYLRPLAGTLRIRRPSGGRDVVEGVRVSMNTANPTRSRLVKTFVAGLALALSGRSRPRRRRRRTRSAHCRARRRARPDRARQAEDRLAEGGRGHPDAARRAPGSRPRRARPSRCKVELKNYETFQDPTTKSGQDVGIVFDNVSTSWPTTTSTKPWVFRNVPKGTHTIRAFAVRPWDESLKEPGAFAW